MESLPYEVLVELCVYFDQLRDFVSLKLINKQNALWLTNIWDDKLFKSNLIKRFEHLFMLTFDASPDLFFEEICDNNATLAVKLLLSDTRVDPAVGGNYSIRHASRNGYTEVIKLLLADLRVNPAADDNCSIQQASESGQTETVKLLLRDPRERELSRLFNWPRVNPGAEDNYAIQWACDNCAIRFASLCGRTEIVKLLLSEPIIDPTTQNNCAIQWASKFGHTEVVKLLLADPRVESVNNYAIWHASQNGHAEIVKLLSLDPRVNPVI